MKTLRIETGSDGWIDSFHLIKDKKEFILKIRQYKLREKGQYYNELHLFDGDVVKKLSKFLQENLK